MENERPTLGLHIEDGVATIVFRNPTRLNALTLEMFVELRRSVEEFARESSVRAIVLRGDGNKAFTTGGDMSEFSRNRSRAEDIQHYKETFRAAIEAVADVRKPTIAAVRGYCFGGGMSIALACDLRFADISAQFCFPSARLGAAMDLSTIRRLVSLVGPSRAKQMFFSADRWTGQQALQIGLADNCFEEEEFDASLMHIAKQVAGNAPLSVAALKRAINAIAAEVKELEEVGVELNACSLSEDHKEGRRAFAEKRKPQFRGL